MLTVEAMGPTTSRVREIGTTPSSGQRPIVGRKPTTPQSAAGMRMEPPVSVPSATGRIPAATAAADPPLEPPATRSALCGFRTGPDDELTDVTPSPSSCIAVLAAIKAPAARKRRTTGASKRGGRRGIAGQPAVVE